MPAVVRQVKLQQYPMMQFTLLLFPLSQYPITTVTLLLAAVPSLRAGCTKVAFTSVYSCYMYQNSIFMYIHVYNTIQFKKK